MPTNFWTWFWPSFWFSGWNNQQFGSNQLTTPTKQQKFPWLTDEQIKRLESISSDPQRQQELYKQAIQQLNSQNVKDNRIATENEMTYRNLNQKDVRQKNYTDSQIRLEQLADLTKDKFWLRQDAPTQEVVNWVIAMAQDKWVSLDEMNNYLDTWDQNFLYNLGLKENPREKLRENAWDNIWDNIRTKANVPIDNIKKRWKRTFNEASEKIYKGILKNFVWDSIIWEMWINLDDYVDTVTDKTVTPALQQDTLNYQNEINERYRALEQKNLDQDIRNYYDNKGYTKLLKEWDFKGFLYKSMWDAAQNWEMPVVIAASVFQPEIWMALMATDSYARENQEAFENMMNNWATYEQAEQWAVAVWLVNAAVEVTLDRLLWWVETSASNAIRKTLMKNVQEEAAKKWLGRILLEWVGTQLRSSAEEWLEEIVQQIVQNAAVKTVNENQELFEWIGSAFEWGFYNPMNLLAWGGNINQNIQANKSEIRQSIMDTATTATTQARDLLDAISDKAQDMWDTAKNKVSWLVDQTYGIDETLRKDIQDNPYSAQVWAKTKDYIEENGRPEKSNDVAKALITDVADRVQESLMDKMEEWKEAWKLYKPLLDAGYSVDISELKDWIDEMLEKYWIKIEEKTKKDGTTETVLNFDETAIDGSEANNIRKIYNWVKNTDKPMSLDEYKNRFRKTMSDMVDFNQVGRDQAGRKTADTQWDKVLKWIRSFANDLAHNQIPELASVDKKFNEWVQIMDEVSDGLVYKDKAKRWVIRDNISQIIKNLDTPNRRELANRLEKIMPWITEEVRAINKMPQLIDHYYKPSGLQQTLTSSAWAAVWGAIGGIPWWILWAWAWYLASKWIDKFKSAKWDKIISETSEDGKAKLNDIQARIENNEKISQEQKAFLEEMSNKLKEWKADKEAEVAKIIAEVSSAEWDVETALNNAIDRLETLWAKQEVKEMKQLLGQVQNQKTEDAQMEQARQEFEVEKENIVNESADQRLPEFKERIYKLQQEEKRIWSVAWKKIWKTFEGKDYKNQQETEWLRKKDKLIEEIWEFYNVDQQEASEIYDRIEKTVSMDDLGFSRKPASSKTAKYQVADEPITKDSSWKSLTKQQQEFFKWSKAVDSNGNLLKLYHGTSASDFTVFQKWKNWSSNTLAKVWYWFSPDEKWAKDFAKNSARWDGTVRAEEVYLDMKNPKIYEPSEINLMEEKARNQKINEQWNIYKEKDNKANWKDYTRAGWFFHDEYDHSYYERQIFQDLKRSYEYDIQYEWKFWKYDPEWFRKLAEEFNRNYDANLDYDKILKDFEEYQSLREDAQKEYAKYQDMAYSDPYEDFQYDIYKIDSTMDNRRTKKDLNMALNDYNSPEKYVEKLKSEWYDWIIIKWTEYDGNVFGGRNDQYVVFDSNQIKRTSNLNPTKNEDIRFQKYWVAWQWEKGISATEWLNIRNFKNWKSVKELANQYWIDTKIVDSISTPEWQRAYWMYWDRLITLSKDLKESTVPHELLHGVFDMVDAKRRTSILEWIQKKLNVDNVQAEEWLADSFSEYYRTGKFWTQWLAKTFVEKIKQFFYQIKSYIDGTYANEKQIRQLFNDIIDWKIEWEYWVYSDPKFQSVWHGSPADFERFDSTHMGEWEWAQAHGWGHYVAVDKDTWLRYGKMWARKYQGKQVWWFGNLYSELDDSKEYSVDVTNAVKEISLLADKEDISIKEAKQKAIERRKGRLRDAEERLEKAKKRWIERNIEDVENIVNRTKILIDIMNKIDENDFSNRNLYEVEIPDPIKKDTPTWSNYLEEDKYYSKAEVKKFLDLMKNIDSGWLKDTKESRIYDLYKKWLDIRWKDLYDMLAYAKGDKQASKFLENLWYDGIHYFGGQDWEAYVIFNDDALQITKHHKY